MAKKTKKVKKIKNQKSETLNTTKAKSKKNIATTKRNNSNVKRVVKKTNSINQKNEPRTAKREKWYTWLKNNILENEKKYSKQYRYRRLFVSLFAVFCFFVVLFSTVVIDYTNASRKNEIPYFTIKTRDEFKQVTIYKGLFYKIWKCDYGNTDLIYATLGAPMGYCEIRPVYDENGVFTNPNKVKMTKSEVNIVRTYYFDDYVYFKTQKEANNAYMLSKALNKILWIDKDSTEIINNDEAVKLAIFGKTEIIDEVESFSFQVNNPEYYKCVKQINNINVFTNYNYLDNSCDTSWETLSLDENICKIAKNSTEFIKNLAVIEDYCK